MTRDDFAKLLRHHRRRYGAAVTMIVYQMIRSGRLNGYLYMVGCGLIEP